MTPDDVSKTFNYIYNLISPEHPVVTGINGLEGSWISTEHACKAILAALREARNQALEEMQEFVSGNKWKLAGDIKTLGHNEACDELLAHIEALKHKDGQP